MEQDIKVFYMMNGQIIFADLVEEDEDTCDYIVKRPVMVMIGQNKQIQMSTAYPFSQIDAEIALNWRQVTAKSDLGWNTQLCAEYNNFWTQLTAQAAGIVLPGNGPAPAPGPMRPTIVKR